MTKSPKAGRYTAKKGAPAWSGPGSVFLAEALEEIAEAPWLEDAIKRYLADPDQAGELPPDIRAAANRLRAAVGSLTGMPPCPEAGVTEPFRTGLAAYGRAVALILRLPVDPGFGSLPHTTDCLTDALAELVLADQAWEAVRLAATALLDQLGAA